MYNSKNDDKMVQYKLLSASQIITLKMKYKVIYTLQNILIFNILVYLMNKDRRMLL